MGPPDIPLEQRVIIYVEPPCAAPFYINARNLYWRGVMEIKEVLPVFEKIIPQIEKGAFLSVQNAHQFNTMTIGWGMTGICWRKPILMVAVRNSRYTYTLLESASDFTVTMPSGNLRDEIFYCGTKSGRDVNKLQECGLRTAPGKKTVTPIIDTPGLHAECRIIYKSPMDPVFLNSDYHVIYPQKDYHTLYYGELVACYETT